MDSENVNVTEATEAPVKEKKKKRKFLIILLPFFIIFLVMVIGVAGFVGHKFSLINIDDESTTIDPNQEFVEAEEDSLDFGEIDDATGKDFKEILKNWAINGGEKMTNQDILNILLIGSDASAKDPTRSNVTDKGNTDVMMLVSINPIKQTIKLVSFMRDSYTYMDQFDRYAKLNAACANGGPGYLVETIENNFKIEIDGYVMVDFDSFVHVIDVLGGVRVDVPAYVADFLGQGFPSGNNILLDGQQALRFSRVRYSDANGDVSRVARQRQVITALIESCKGATLSEINAVADVILANVRTNISRKAIFSYAAKAVTDGWPNFEISQITMPTPDARYGYNSRSTAWIWVVDYPLCAQKLQLELYGDTNIKLDDNRKTAITVLGGYVSKKTTD
ncbi:MAG: LCP family protein [Clostridia bacterium]|nr:LCP family protein [Clostridia bacterium]